MAKSKLRKITPYKTKKKYDKETSVVGIGAVLIITGLVTAASSYDFQDKSFRNGVVLSAGVQLGLGSILSAIGSKKKYKMEDGWHF